MSDAIYRDCQTDWLLVGRLSATTAGMAAAMGALDEVPSCEAIR